MTRFVEGEDRRQGVLLPEYLDDYVAEDNPVRVIDVFVDELDSGALGFDGVVPGGDRTSGLSSGRAAEDLRLRLHQPDRVEPPAGARGPAQRRADVADRASGAGLQDHRGLQEGQWPGDPGGLPPVHGSVPTAGSVRPCGGGDRRQQVQGGERPRQELHQGPSQQRMEQVEASIERYMAALETADRQDRELAPAKSVRLKDKIAALKAQMQAFKAMEAEVPPPISRSR